MLEPKAAAVLARYNARLAEEEALMRQAGPDLMAQRDRFLLALGEEAAQVLAHLAVARGAKRLLELGTSYGYSTLFLAAAAARTGGVLHTLELAADKQAYARQMLEDAGLGEHVAWHCGDALVLLDELEGPFDFVLVDLWKELYVPCLERFHPKLADQALIAADNMLYPEMHRPDAQAYRDAVDAKADLESVLLPIGSGIELSCKWG